MRVNRVKNTVSVLMIITILSQVIAFIRESVFAYYFGTSVSADAFVMANQIPITLFAIISSAINTVMLPLYTEKKENYGIHTAKSFLKTAMFMFILLCIIFIVLAEFFSVQIVKLFAPSFNGEIFQMTLQFTKILFPSIIGTVLINVFAICYNSDDNFFYPSVSALSQNILIILIMVLSANVMGIKAVVWGTIWGIIINLLLLVLPRREVFLEKIMFEQAWDDLRKVLYKVIPVAVGVGIAEINRIIDRAIASGLNSGSITALNYANKLSVVFSALILSAVSTVSFKKFSEAYMKKKFKKRFEDLIDYSLLLIAILLPITIGVIILRKELIQIAFGRGAFDLDSVIRTSNIFFYTALGIVFIAVREILSKYFYSSGNTKTPMVNAVFGIVINIILNLFLSKFMGASGLALATTISNITVCILLFISIKKYENYFSFFRLWTSLLKLILASLGMLVVLMMINSIVSISSNVFKILLNLFTSIVIYTVFLIIMDYKLLKRLFQLMFK